MRVLRAVLAEDAAGMAEELALQAVDVGLVVAGRRTRTAFCLSKGWPGPTPITKRSS